MRNKEGMINPRKQYLVAGLIALIAATSPAHAQLAYDDGVYEKSGLGSLPSGSLTYASHFVAPVGGFTLQSMSAAFSHVIGTPTVNGTAFRAAVWSDPNSDGNPSDAVLVSFLDSTIQNAQLPFSLPRAAVFAVYDIPDVTLLAGQSFFVGGIISVQSAQFVTPIDTSATDNAGWVSPGNGWGGGTVSLNSLVPGDFLLRANGVIVVPESSTLALALSAVCCFATARLGMIGAMLIKRRRTATH